MAFDAGELVATIKAAGLQAFESGMAQAEGRFRAVGKAATEQGAAADAAGRKAAAAAKTQGDAAAKAGQQTSQAARQSKAATDSATAAAQKQATTTRQAGTAAQEAGGKAVQAERQQKAATDAATSSSEKQTKATRDTGTAAQDSGRKGAAAGKASADAARAAETQLQKQKQAASELGRTLTLAGTAALAVFGAAATQSAQFESRLAQLRTLGQYSSQEMDRAGNAALTAGAKYGLTANDVADAEIELQKANVGLTEQLGGALPGALTLAASGQLDVADATSIAVTAMTQFQKQGQDVPHIADLLAAGADRALGSVGDLGMALKQGGLVAAQYGWSLEDTTATLSAFANAGLIGSDAGTSLKTMLLALATPTQQQAKLMQQLGIQTYDANGHFVTSAELAGQLQEHLGGLDEASRNSALGILFGSDAVRAANVLYTEGQAGIEGWTRTVDEAGFAAQQAAGKQDSLAGDAQKVAAAFQNDLIRAGQSVDGILRGIVQSTGWLLNVIGDVPQPILAAAAVLTALGGAAAVGGGGLLLLAPKVLDARDALRVMRQEAAAATYGTGKFSSALRGVSAAAGVGRKGLSAMSAFMGGPWGAAVIAAGALLAVMQIRQEQVNSVSATTTNALLTQKDALTTYAQAMKDASAFGEKPLVDPFADLDEKQVSQLGEYAKQARTLGGALQALQTPTPFAWISQLNQEKSMALQPWIDGFHKLDASLVDTAQTSGPQAAQAFQKLTEPLHGNQQQIGMLLDQFPKYRDELVKLATAQGVNTTAGTHAQQNMRLLAVAATEAKGAGDAQAQAATKQAAAIAEIQGTAAGASQTVSQLAQDIKGLGSAQLDARAANRQLEQAVDDAAAAFGKNGHSLDISTQKGRDNQAALDAIASAATNAASATYAQTGSVDEAAAKMSQARTDFVRMATSVLGSADAAKRLADRLGLIPEDVRSLVTVRTDDAQTRIQALKDNLLNIPDGEATIYVNAVASGVDQSRARQIAVNALKGGGMADGGAVEGPGAPGVDSMVAAVAPGEHMWTHQEVQAVGGQGAMYRMRAAARTGAFAGAFARGGAIGDSEDARDSANAQVAKLTERINRAKRAQAAAERAQKRADSAYRKAQDRQAGIYGKGTGAQKHSAVLETREAKKRADAASKAAKAAADRVDELRKDRDDAKQTAADQTQRRAQLGTDREDLAFQVTRGDLVNADSPYGATDQALQASRDTNYSSTQRKALDQAAHQTGDAIASLVRQEGTVQTSLQAHTDALAKNQDGLSTAQGKLEDATSSLDNLKSAAASLASGVASTVRGFFSLGATVKDEQDVTTSVSHNAGTKAQWDEKVSTVIPGGTTVAAIRASVTGSASSMQAFAKQLDQLRARGYSTAVVTDVANLGVEQGSQVATALLRGTSADVKAINSGYVSMTSASNAAGQTVAGMTYGTQITDAQKQVTLAQQGVTYAQKQVDLTQRAIDADNLHAVALQKAIETQQQKVVAALQAALGTGGKAAAATRGTMSSVSYADGGIRDAQIQPAGASILWAEAETGGESYIPHAPAKRARSQQILQATAERFGMIVVPMASGGIYASRSAAPAPAQMPGGDSYDLSGSTFGADPADVVRALQLNRRRQIMRNELRRVQP